jgi:hypothetical protein
VEGLAIIAKDFQSDKTQENATVNIFIIISLLVSGYNGLNPL